MADSQNKSKKISIQYPPGIYRVTFDLSPESFTTIIANQELELFYLHGSHIYDKQSFIASLAETAKFPDYAQTNWDSLEECLRDLSWCPAAGYFKLPPPMTGRPHSRFSSPPLISGKILIHQCTCF